MRCELVEGGMENWWCIERLEHDGREWMAPLPGFPGSMQFMRSAQPSDACIEGYAEEMIKIAIAIENDASISFKRCAVLHKANEGGAWYELYSPRNTQGEHAILTLEEAQELAADIRTKLGVPKKAPVDER